MRLHTPGATTRIAMLAALLATAAPAAAQLDEPSTTQGLFVGLHLVGATLDDDSDDGVDALSGSGLGLELGYGFSSGLALFLNIDGGELDDEGGAAELVDTRTQVDLGLRMNFGAGRRRLVPFMEAAFSGIALDTEDDLGEDGLLSGGGISIGGGVQYFVRRNVSLDAGLRATMGAFTSLERGGDEVELDDQHFAATRLTLGATWNP